MSYALTLPDGSDAVLDNVLVDAVCGPYLFVRDPWAQSPILPVYADAVVDRWWSLQVSGRISTVGGERLLVAEKMGLYTDAEGRPTPPLPPGMEECAYVEDIPILEPPDSVPIPSEVCREERELEGRGELLLLDAPAGSIASAKLDGGAVSLTGKVVTAVFREADGSVESFYIQEVSVPSGIKVVPDENMAGWLPVEEGEVVDVSGEVVREEADPECYILPQSVQYAGTNTLPGPVGMNQRALAGGEFGLQPALYLATGESAREGAGLNAVGIRVRVWGAYLSHSTGSGHAIFRIDDGSYLSAGQDAGLKVVYWSASDAPDPEEYVTVTGVLSAEMCDGKPVPVLRVPASGNTNVRRVKWNSPDPYDGSTWDKAYHTVQAAINAAQAGDEVWVAGDSEHPYEERITLKDGVRVYGGFAGTETVREARDWTVNETIIDGNQGGTVVSVQSCWDPATRLDGFTVTKGNGGGIYVSGSRTVIANNTIADNSGTLGGGVTANSCTGGVVVTHNTVRDNHAFSGGGGIYMENCSAQIRRNVIESNSVDSTGEGGGAMMESCNSPIISANEFTDNYGGSHGGGITFHYCDDVLIVNNVFWRNHVNDENIGGAGAQLYTSHGIIVNNTFVENWNGSAQTWPQPVEQAVGYGGAVLVRLVPAEHSADLVNNVFYDNRARAGKSAASIWWSTAGVSYSDAYPKVSEDPEENRDWHYHADDLGSTITVAGSCTYLDPLFCTSPMFWLLSGSPVRGIAQNPSQNPAVPTVDKDGRRRPGTNGSTDMGAHEDNPPCQ